MRVLVACEFSGIVRDAFRERGHDAVSCDLEPTERPGPHLKQDVFSALHFTSASWDMMIAFPPCTHLASSGARWFAAKRADGRQQAGIDFFMALVNAPDIPRIAIENPVGIMSTRYRKPDQIIQPYQFGEDASKATCLWLKGLPKLVPTQMIDPHYACQCGGPRFGYALGKYGCPNCCGDSGAARPVWANQTPSGQNRLGPSDDRARIRSHTFAGIAAAMADQWGRLATS